MHKIWTKAIERRESDPDGAITIARTLLEQVCKYILDEKKLVYSETDDLPKLYRLVAGSMNLSPSKNSDDAITSVLGGCHSVVEGIGTLRNKMSDAHGRSREAARPSTKHATLAVNLAGAMAMFLVETLNEQS